MIMDDPYKYLKQPHFSAFAVLIQANISVRLTSLLRSHSDDCRSIRLGYNVLLLDTDVMIMDDPYKYLKQPPFSAFTVVNQAESPTEPNGGVLYVQGAAPDGPAAFMFSEIVARPYRWADDDWETAGMGFCQTLSYMNLSYMNRL